MEPPPKPSSSTSLFQVYLRLRPHAAAVSVPHSIYPSLPSPERFLTVEPLEGEHEQDALPTHITIHPPSDSRKRAVEKFAFTKVFEEQTSQLEVFSGAGAVPLVEGVLDEGRDALIATLGVTGSGKTHTILGSKSQRGLTQLSLDLLYRSLDGKTVHPSHHSSLVSSLVVADASEAQIQSASGFLDGIYGDNIPSSRAATPMTVGNRSSSSANLSTREGIWSQWSVLGIDAGTPPPDEKEREQRANVDHGECLRKKALCQAQRNQLDQDTDNAMLHSNLPFWNSPRITKTKAKLRFGNVLQDATYTPSTRRHVPQRPSALPRLPDISSTVVASSKNMDYAILVSMYEVYNDRIFDLLSHPRNPKDLRRRPLLFKSTEGSPDRKLVAGLKKVVCGTYEEAMMVLETGLMERRVAGTGSNTVSSRSHGFFCVEVKKRHRGGMASAWTGSQLTIVDLAGSERARNAKTAGATLAEAGKINESLMYLGQCLQLQSDFSENSKTIVPFRQCKLTELLFSNSFPSAHPTAQSTHHSRNPQKAVMVVTADPLGDFNATSQILRYSALAREVTIPRIPSVASIVFKDGALPTNGKASGRSSPDQAHINDLEDKLSALNDQVEILALRLAEETSRRRDAEEAWQTAAAKLEILELEVRDECCEEMERRVEAERRRWMDALGEEADRNDEHMDRKLDLLSRGIQIHEDDTATVPLMSNANKNADAARVAALEDENDELRRRLDRLERELQARSPTKPRASRSAAIPKAPHIKSPPPKLGSLSMGIADDPFVEGKENVVLQKLEDLVFHDEERGVEGVLPVKKVKGKTPAEAAGRKMRTLTPHRGVAGMRGALLEEGDEGGVFLGTP